MTRGRAAGLALALSAGAAAPALGQAPFTTDDAGTTAPRRFHLELAAAFAELPAADRPAHAQQTLVTSIALGLGDRVEVGIDWPWIAIRSIDAPDAVGSGDLNTYLKWRILDASGRRPALALVGALELPTGEERRGLGSGERDETLYGIVEWSGPGRVDLRANLGVVFAGNSLTGDVGLRSDSRIWIGGVSGTVEGERLALGVELTGAVGQLAGELTREVRLQAGARRALGPRAALALAVQRGWHAAPPWQASLGLVLDP